MLSDIWSYIAGQFTGMDFWDTIQTVGLILSFIYLWLEFHQKPLFWVVSAMCSMIYASVYFHSKIYADMGFSCFNICLCVYGFIKWLQSDRKGQAKNSQAKGNSGITYRHFRAGEFMAVLGVSALIWGAIFCILRFLTDSPVPALDSLTTMLNIVGTWVLAQKIIEVWGIWFLVNAISIYIYCRRGLHLTTILLYSFWLGASVYGYIKWKRRGTCIA
ncbi:MAG: nicotinamide mononucleotide transporter [Bacteroidaceae bacterium]|nr:nicotinamide mononucleotide transporter [Bacteroidaceae bacterium]MBP5347562.1 nicotinamide mononucleotide transporter [Bacteroidaceae bacterium]